MRVMLKVGKEGNPLSSPDSAAAARPQGEADAAAMSLDGAGGADAPAGAPGSWAWSGGQEQDLGSAGDDVYSDPNDDMDEDGDDDDDDMVEDGRRAWVPLEHAPLAAAAPAAAPLSGAAPAPAARAEPGHTDAAPAEPGSGSGAALVPPSVPAPAAGAGLAVAEGGRSGRVKKPKQHYDDHLDPTSLDLDEPLTAAGVMRPASGVPPENKRPLKTDPFPLQTVEELGWPWMDFRAFCARLAAVRPRSSQEMIDLILPMIHALYNMTRTKYKIKAKRALESMARNGGTYLIYENDHFVIPPNMTECAVCMAPVGDDAYICDICPLSYHRECLPHPPKVACTDVWACPEHFRSVHNYTPTWAKVRASPFFVPQELEEALTAEQREYWEQSLKTPHAGIVCKLAVLPDPVASVTQPYTVPAPKKMGRPRKRQFAEDGAPAEPPAGDVGAGVGEEPKRRRARRRRDDEDGDFVGGPVTKDLIDLGKRNAADDHYADKAIQFLNEANNGMAQSATGFTVLDAMETIQKLVADKIVSKREGTLLGYLASGDNSAMFAELLDVAATNKDFAKGHLKMLLKDEA